MPTTLARKEARLVVAPKDIRAIVIAMPIRNGRTKGMARVIISGLFREEPEKTELQKDSQKEMIHSLERIKQSLSEFPLVVRDLKTYLEGKCDIFLAGGVANFVGNWQKLTSDREILTTSKGATIEFDAPPFPVATSIVSFSSEEITIINSETDKLLAKDIIETTSLDPDETLSNIFIRPKKDGSQRLILNLKGLNQYFTYHYFKMDTLYSMLKLYKLVEKNCYVASLDLKDAYYSVAVNASNTKYLRFMWNNVLYQFTCLPNGPAVSMPQKIYEITKLLKSPLNSLHKKGHIVASYIVDLFLLGRTYNLCVANVVDAFVQFDSLGFTIHPEKPGQRNQYSFPPKGWFCSGLLLTRSLCPLHSHLKKL